MLFFCPKFLGLPVIPSKSAMIELMQCNLLLDEAVEILEIGFDCCRSKRKKDTLEKCVRKGIKL